MKRSLVRSRHESIADRVILIRGRGRELKPALDRRAPLRELRASGGGGLTLVERLAGVLEAVL